MKTYKTILISFLVLFLTVAGVSAANETAPTYCIGANGEAITVPTDIETIGNNGGDTTKAVQNLEFSNATNTANNISGSWYWTGPQTVQENGTTKQAEATNIQLSSTPSNNQGTINIVVGPGGDDNTGTVALNITNTTPWTLGQNQTINIYQAATSDGKPQPLEQCALTLVNSNRATEGNTQVNPAQAALIVNGGGTLNVNSGILIPNAQGIYGLSQTGGLITVSPYGQLQPTWNEVTTSTTPGPTAKSDSPVADAIGLSITGGTLNNQGFLKVSQNYSATGWDFATITNSITSSSPSGSQGLVLNNGTVQTSSPCPSSLGSNNGVWIQSIGNVGSGETETPLPSIPIQATTNVITAFGNATLNTGFINIINLSQSGNSLTVNEGANLTIPDGYTLSIGPATGTVTTAPTLTVKGELTIDGNATVNMKSNSQLNNSGTITVLPDDNINAGA